MLFLWRCGGAGGGAAAASGGSVRARMCECCVCVDGGGVLFACDLNMLVGARGLNTWRSSKLSRFGCCYVVVACAVLLCCDVCTVLLLRHHPTIQFGVSGSLKGKHAKPNK